MNLTYRRGIKQDFAEEFKFYFREKIKVKDYAALKAIILYAQGKTINHSVV